MKRKWIVLLVLWALSLLAQDVQWVGVRRELFEYFTASQQASKWCWAASIQMVLNYYGIQITQPDIVARTYGTDANGRLPDWGASMETISASLNNWGIDRAGQSYVVRSFFGNGAPVPLDLINQLRQGRPVVLGYRSGPNTAHAVVATGAGFYDSPTGPSVAWIIVRDPWPSPQNVASRGRIVYSGKVLANAIQGYWFVDVQRLAR